MAGTAEGDVIHVGNRQYQLHSRLGTGGFSEVFLGVDVTTKKRVALKLMSPPKNSADARSQLTQTTAEIKTMKQLNHPNVVRLLGYDLKCKVNGKPSIVMVQQLCPKGELFDYLMYTTKFEPKWAMALFHQLCAGLKHMHDNNIAHRDLKPENLLFNDNYTLKIADFGFSHQYQKQTEARPHQMRTELGTKGYMAPEIISPSGSYSNKADVFAAGVILFIMLAGFPPFQTAEKCDWWFDKLMKKKEALFWKAHERTAKFENGAKRLLIAMMAPTEKDRPSVGEVLNDGYVIQYSNYQKHELAGELKRRKQLVDKKKIEEGESRDTLMEVLEKIDYDSFRPDQDDFVCLNQFLHSEFHKHLESSNSRNDVLKAVLDAVESTHASDTRTSKQIFQEKQEVLAIFNELTNQQVYDTRQILLKRETDSPEWNYLATLFPEKMVDHFATMLKETPVGKIDDWDMVQKLSKYEEDVNKLPQYPTGYCNAWKTKIGFGILVYCVHTFAKGRCKVKVDKKNHVIILTMQIKKKIVLPTEEANGDFSWKQGTMPVKVELEMKLFKGDQNYNVLTLQNKTAFAMNEARAIIQEMTTNRTWHLCHFLERFGEKGPSEPSVLLNAYYQDKEIDFLPEVGDENSWGVGL